MRFAMLALLVTVLMLQEAALAHPPTAANKKSMHLLSAVPPIQATDAVTLAQRAVGARGRAQAIKLLTGHTGPAWMVVVATEEGRFRVLVDAEHGRPSAPVLQPEETVPPDEEPPILPPLLSLRDAITRIDQMLHGHVIAADLERDEGSARYKLKLLIHGRQQTIEMDADTGSLIRQPTDNDHSDHDRP